MPRAGQCPARPVHDVLVPPADRARVDPELGRVLLHRDPVDVERPQEGPLGAGEAEPLQADQHCHAYQREVGQDGRVHEAQRCGSS